LSIQNPFIIRLNKPLVNNMGLKRPGQNGIIAAKKAGCRPVGITTTFSEEKLRNAGADMVIDSFSGRYGYLHEMGPTSQVESI
jgi:hypothetical protein